MSKQKGEAEMFIDMTGASTSKGPVAIKRRHVDTQQGTEVLDSTRSKSVPDEEIKKRAIGLILHWHEYLGSRFELPNFNNIDDVSDVTSIISITHSEFRQEANAAAGGSRKNINADFEFSAAGKKLKFGVFSATMKTLATAYGFTYTTTEREGKALGTLTSILTLIVAFPSRFNETRIGNNTITVKNSTNSVDVMEVNRFGLSSSHCSLLTGCTYNPSIQSSMKNFLGPMTIAINLCMTTDARCQKAWVDAFCQAFKLFPGVEEIANILKGSKETQTAIMQQLAIIALCGVTVTSNKAFIPASLLLHVARINPTYRQKFSAAPNLDPIIDENYHSAILNMDFSGAGLYNLYHHAIGVNWSIRQGKDMTARTAREVTFHALFGTHMEDLSLLKWMTGHDFQRRSEMGCQLLEIGSNGNTIDFQLIPFIRICDLSNAPQTDFFVGDKDQMAREPTLSGERILDDESQNQGRVIAMNSVDGILTRLNETRLGIANRIKEEGRIEYGTTPFFLPDYAKEGKGYGEKVHEVPKLSGEYFDGLKKDTLEEDISDIFFDDLDYGFWFYEDPELGGEHFYGPGDGPV